MVAILSLLALASAALATKVAVKYHTDANGTQTSYDPVYDNKTDSTSLLDCAGTITAKNATWKTFSQLPNFPNIGGGAAVTGYDSNGCASCWALTYQNQTINVLVIDYAQEGFNIAESTMNNFTDGQATTVGIIDVSAKQVSASDCGW